MGILIFLSGIISGVVGLALLVCKSAEKIDSVSVYKHGAILKGGNCYFVVGEHPFWHGQRVDGLYRLEKTTSGGNPTTIAIYSPESK